jgi:hypothetical protein
MTTASETIESSAAPESAEQPKTFSGDQSGLRAAAEAVAEKRKAGELESEPESKPTEPIIRPTFRESPGPITARQAGKVLAWHHDKMGRDEGYAAAHVAGAITEAHAAAPDDVNAAMADALENPDSDWRKLVADQQADAAALAEDPQPEPTARAWDAPTEQERAQEEQQRQASAVQSRVRPPNRADRPGRVRRRADPRRSECASSRAASPHGAVGASAGKREP